MCEDESQECEESLIGGRNIPTRTAAPTRTGILSPLPLRRIFRWYFKKKKKILIRTDWILCIALCLSLWFIDWLWQLGFGFGVWFRVQLGEGRLWFVILNFSSWIFLHFNVSTSYRWSIVVSFAKIISYRLVKILSLFAIFYLIKSFSNSIFN